MGYVRCVVIKIKCDTTAIENSFINETNITNEIVFFMKKIFRKRKGILTNEIDSEKCCKQ